MSIRDDSQHWNKRVSHESPEEDIQKEGIKNEKIRKPTFASSLHA